MKPPEDARQPEAKPFHILKHHEMRDSLPMWIIYRPVTSDYPGQWVARMHLSLPSHRTTDLVITGKTLQETRDKLPPGLFNLGRQEQDEPVIEEVWI